MRDVVVIGGGLSGLSACYELERCAARYTVIEVRRRFGGAIRTTAAAGFVIDAGGFVFHPFADRSWLADLGLLDQIVEIGEGARVFRDGSETLIRALAGELNGGRLMRMAVSSIGTWRARFTICLENGLMLDAGALILAVPGRYAARMLWNLAPEAAEQLAAFRYDSIRRLSLGYHKRDLPERIGGGLDASFPFIISTDLPGRVPDRDHLLLQVGLRSSEAMSADEALRAVTRQFGWSASPLAARVDHWPEADPLSPYDGHHGDNMRALRAALPPGMSVIGSDYCPQTPQRPGIADLDERMRQGREAARAALAYLKAAEKR